MCCLLYMQNFNEIGIRFLYKIYTFIGGAFLKSVSVHVYTLKIIITLCEVRLQDCFFKPNILL